jgi:hypothetical protein
MIQTLDHLGSELPVMLISLRLFTTFTSVLVPSFMLKLCLIFKVFYSASNALLEVLIIESPHRLRPSHVSTLLNYKINTHKFISLIWSC